jgi:hypothetical protein
MYESVESNFFSFLVGFDEFGNDLSDVFHEEDVLIYFVVILFVGFVRCFKCLGFTHQLYISFISQILYD